MAHQRTSRLTTRTPEQSHTELTDTDTQHEDPRFGYCFSPYGSWVQPDSHCMERIAFGLFSQPLMVGANYLSLLSVLCCEIVCGWAWWTAVCKWQTTFSKKPVGCNDNVSSLYKENNNQPSNWWVNRWGDEAKNAFVSVSSSANLSDKWWVLGVDVSTISFVLQMAETAGHGVDTGARTLEV